MSDRFSGRFSLRSQSGTTLVELMVTMMILGIVLPAALMLLTRVQSGFNTGIDRSVNATQTGLVMQQVAKEVQSAEAFTICSVATCASTPAADGSGNISCTTTTATPATLTSCYLVVYTQTYASTREQYSPGPSAPFSCIEWRIFQVASSPNLYVLQSRRWPPDWEGNPTGLVTGWRYVSDALPTVAATFTLPSTAMFGGRLLRVSVSMNNQSANKTAHGSQTSNTTLTRDLTGSNVVALPNPCVPPNGTIPS